MQVVVIGNGFDLGTGLPTRYTDFFNYREIFEQNQEFIEELDNLFEKEQEFIDELNRLLKKK